MSIVKIGMDNSAMKVKLEDAGILDACVYGNTLIIVINNKIGYYNDDKDNMDGLVDIIHDIIESYGYVNLGTIGRIPLIAEMLIVLPNEEIANCKIKSKGTDEIYLYSLNNKLNPVKQIFGCEYNSYEYVDPLNALNIDSRWNFPYFRLSTERGMHKKRLEDLIKVSFNLILSPSDLNVKQYIEVLIKGLYQRTNVFKNQAKKIKWAGIVSDLYSLLLDDEEKYTYLLDLIEKSKLYEKLYEKVENEKVENCYTDPRMVDAVCDILKETDGSFENIVYHHLLKIFMFAPDNVKGAYHYVKSMNNHICHVVNRTMND